MEQMHNSNDVQALAKYLMATAVSVLGTSPPYPNASFPQLPFRITSLLSSNKQDAIYPIATNTKYIAITPAELKPDLVHHTHH